MMNIGPEHTVLEQLNRDCDPVYDFNVRHPDIAPLSGDLRPAYTTPFDRPLPESKQFCDVNTIPPPIKWPSKVPGLDSSEFILNTIETNRVRANTEMQDIMSNALSSVGHPITIAKPTYISPLEDMYQPPNLGDKLLKDGASFAEDHKPLIPSYQPVPIYGSDDILTPPLLGRNLLKDGASFAEDHEPLIPRHQPAPIYGSDDILTPPLLGRNLFRDGASFAEDHNIGLTPIKGIPLDDINPTLLQSEGVIENVNKMSSAINYLINNSSILDNSPVEPIIPSITRFEPPKYDFLDSKPKPDYLSSEPIIPSIPRFEPPKYDFLESKPKPDYLSSEPIIPSIPRFEPPKYDFFESKPKPDYLSSEPIIPSVPRFEPPKYDILDSKPKDRFEFNPPEILILKIY